MQKLKIMTKQPYFLTAVPGITVLRGLLLTAVLLIPALALGQAVNPLDSSPRAAAAGGSLFRAQCATCHGADARGIAGIQAPDLTQLWSQPGQSDSAVFQTIRNGIPGSIMPPHAFTDTETWMLVTYLKSLGPADSMASYGGDRGRGARLFDKNCSGCHLLNGSGGALGPDLTGIATRRSRQSLVTSIREPGAVLVRGYRPVTLVTRDNLRIDGTIKSEDAFSIQIMDRKQRLRGFRKKDLARLHYPDRSLMPEFNQATLNDSELEDLLSYLAGQ